MAPWPPKIVKRFSTIPPNPRDNDFYAPYNKLLYTLFPADSDYTVAPQSYPIIHSRDSVNFTIEFEVLLEDKPVFFVEINEPRKIILMSAREEADKQMRKCMGDLAPSCPFDTLHGVSAFGTRLAFYKYDKESSTIFPVRICPVLHRATDTAPLDRWDCDILEDEGGERFQALVADIKAKCDQL